MIRLKSLLLEATAPADLQTLMKLHDEIYNDVGRSEMGSASADVHQAQRVYNKLMRLYTGVNQAVKKYSHLFSTDPNREAGPGFGGWYKPGTHEQIADYQKKALTYLKQAEEKEFHQSWSYLDGALSHLHGILNELIAAHHEQIERAKSKNTTNEIIQEGALDVSERPKNLPPEMLALYKKHDDLFVSFTRTGTSDVRAMIRLFNQTRIFYQAVASYLTRIIKDDQQLITNKEATRYRVIHYLQDAKHQLTLALEKIHPGYLDSASISLDFVLSRTHSALDHVALSMQKSR